MVDLPAVGRRERFTVRVTERTPAPARLFEPVGLAAYPAAGTRSVRRGRGQNPAPRLVSPPLLPLTAKGPLAAGRADAELARHGQEVELRPVLCQFAISHPEDIDNLQLDFLACGRGAP